jgi:hypothetical protein
MEYTEEQRRCHAGHLAQMTCGQLVQRERVMIITVSIGTGR